MTIDLNQSLLIAVLSSSVIGNIVVGIFAHRGKQNEYKNDYFKLVLSKRIKAYEVIEDLIWNFKMSVVDDKGRPYHRVFSDKDGEDPSRILLILLAFAQASFWFSDDLFKKTQEISLLVFARPNELSWEDFGIANYKNFVLLRTEIEKLNTRDIATLQEVEKFLKNKKHEVNFVDNQTFYAARASGSTDKPNSPIT